MTNCTKCGLQLPYLGHSSWRYYNEHGLLECEECDPEAWEKDAERNYSAYKKRHNVKYIQWSKFDF